MSLKPLTERQQTLIVNNVLAACKDITKLNKTGYNFLYLVSGFIAHYNMYGFIDYYENTSLEHDIVSNAGQNQWCNFRPGDENYEYYSTKAEVYNRILHGLLVEA